MLISAPITAGPDRTPAGSARRVPDCLSEALDDVISIIRTEDEPKPAMMKKCVKLTRSAGRGDPQYAPAQFAQARGIRDPHRGQEPSWRVEGPQGAAPSGNPSNGPRSASRFGKSATFSDQRAAASAAPCSPTRRSADLAAIEEAFVERECTVVISEKGWVRTLKGRVEDISGLASRPTTSTFFRPRQNCWCSTNGKFYSLDVAKLPGGRGHGEPNTAMFIDMEQDAAIVSLFVDKGERKFLIRERRRPGFCRQGRGLRRQHRARASRC